MGRRKYEHLFFSFMKLCSKSASCNRIPQLFLYSIATVSFKKAAIIIAIHGRKTLHSQLSKIILFGMYNCNFEAIN